MYSIFVGINCAWARSRMYDVLNSLWVVVYCAAHHGWLDESFCISHISLAFLLKWLLHSFPFISVNGSVFSFSIYLCLSYNNIFSVSLTLPHSLLLANVNTLSEWMNNIRSKWTYGIGKQKISFLFCLRDILYIYVNIYILRHELSIHILSTNIFDLLYRCEGTSSKTHMQTWQNCESHFWAYWKILCTIYTYSLLCMAKLWYACLHSLIFLCLFLFIWFISIREPKFEIIQQKIYADIHLANIHLVHLSFLMFSRQ